MAATITIRVFTGAAPGAMSAAVVGVDMISADNDTNSGPNRTANPIIAGERSYEKWLAGYVDASPDNWVNDFHLWGDGAVMALTGFYYGFTAVYVQPVKVDSVVAMNDFTSAVLASKANWHTLAGGQANLFGIGDKTRYAVFQLDVAAAHPGGSWAQEIINFDYTEA